MQNPPESLPTDVTRTTLSTLLANAQLLQRRGNTSEACEQYVQIVRQHPDCIEAYQGLFPLLQQQRRFDDLLQHGVAAQHALTSPFLPAIIAQLISLRFMQRHTEAIALIQQQLPQYPNQAYLYMQYGLLLKETGQLTLAKEQFDIALEIDPALYEAYWLRADVLDAPDEQHLQQILQQLAKPLTDSAKAQLHYALARAFEKRQQYSHSFEHLQRGAAAKRKTLSYDSQSDAAEHQAIASFFPTAEPITATDSSQRDALPKVIPIFICGLPRSGTTLVEQILASHPEITAGDELYEFAQATDDCLTTSQLEQRFPQWLSSSTPQQIQQIGRRYLELTNRLQGTAYFTDKMPLNYKAIGLIARALPQAKIIYCQRHPIDMLFSCYKQLFADGISFSYQLDELAESYIAHRQLIAHWQHILQHRMYTVTYEQLVQQQRIQSENLLSFVGTSWDEQCMHFYQSKRAVYTVSSTQVRQPMFSNSIGHWRHYEQQLQPLMQRLAPFIQQYESMLCNKN